MEPKRGRFPLHIVTPVGSRTLFGEGEVRMEGENAIFTTTVRIPEDQLENIEDPLTALIIDYTS